MVRKVHVIWIDIKKYLQVGVPIEIPSPACGYH